MNELKDVKSVLKDVLSFFNRLNPNSRPHVLIRKDYSVKIEIWEMDYRDISAYIKYFTYISDKIQPWTEGTLFSVEVYVGRGILANRGFINSFLFKSQKTQKSFVIKDWNGSQITTKTLYPIKDLMLD